MTDGVRDETESRGRRSLRDDRGMTAVEFVVLTPLLFLLLMLMVQFALYLFAKQAATAAVRGGARMAREEAGSAGQACQDPTSAWQQDAAKTATSQAQALGGQLILNAAATSTFTVDPNLNADCKISLVTVTLHSEVVSVFPGFGMTIDVHAGGPVEQPVKHP